MSRPPRPPRHASPLSDVPGAFINLSHHLRFARAGYLASMDAELSGLKALPATRDLLAAFHPVVFHHKAIRQGIPVAPMTIIEDEENLAPPCRLVPAHPWMWESGDADTLLGAKRIWKSVSMGGGLPVAMFGKKGKPFEARSFLGMTLAEGKEELAWKVWQVFHLPLIKILGFVDETGPKVTHLDRLKLPDLTERDLAFFAEVSERPYSGVSWTA